MIGPIRWWRKRQYWKGFRWGRKVRSAGAVMHGGGYWFKMGLRDGSGGKWPMWVEGEQPKTPAWINPNPPPSPWSPFSEFQQSIVYRAWR